MSRTSPLRLPEAPLGRIEAEPPSSAPPRVGIGRWAVPVLAALVTACLAATVTAAQVTERSSAEALIERVGRSLFEIQEVVAYHWDDLSAAAAAGLPLVIEDFPLELELTAADLANGQLALADLIAVRASRQLYDDGFDALRETPRGAADIFSQASAFSNTIGRLTGGGRTLALIALVVSLGAFVPLALGSLAQGRSFNRLLYLGAALGGGGLLALIVGYAARSRFSGLAEASGDPLLVELYRIGVDVLSLLLRNGGIIAILGAALTALAIIAAQLEQARLLRRLA